MGLRQSPPNCYATISKWSRENNYPSRRRDTRHASVGHAGEQNNWIGVGLTYCQIAQSK